jgi:hypothetical protein
MTEPPSGPDDAPPPANEIMDALLRAAGAAGARAAVRGTTMSSLGHVSALDAVLTSRRSTHGGASLLGMTTQEDTVTQLRLFSEVLFFAGINDLARLKQVLKQVRPAT